MPFCRGGELIEYSPCVRGTWSFVMRKMLGNSLPLVAVVCKCNVLHIARIAGLDVLIFELIGVTTLRGMRPLHQLGNCFRSSCEIFSKEFY